MTFGSRLWRLIPAVALSAGLAGCTTSLMPTPNIYADGHCQLFDADLAPELRSSKADILYVTDRAPEPKKDGTMRYGYRRSASLAFGSVVVEIGRDLSWEQVVALSTERRRPNAVSLTVRSITEAGRLAPTPLPLAEIGGNLVTDPAAMASQQELAGVFIAEVERRLAFTPSKDAFVYVHGFNNTFDYAASVVAEFWHFDGRPGVPILYSWPAGSPGLLKGYPRDRESGEFTIFHLKIFLRTLAQAPSLHRIHVIAHSRGTDVAASALRELLIETRAAGGDLGRTLKIGNVVLASPDLDVDVMEQRFSAERFPDVCERLTVYVSKKDTAISVAEWLFQSRERLGKLRPEDLSEAAREWLTRMGKVDIVDARVKTGFMGHTYYHSSPAVSSDLMLAVRFGYAPGSPQRPLRQVAPHYYVLDSERYPFADQPRD
jgi:esterase/lipase superfamily enzyme